MKRTKLPIKYYKIAGFQLTPIVLLEYIKETNPPSHFIFLYYMPL